VGLRLAGAQAPAYALTLTVLYNIDQKYKYRRTRVHMNICVKSSSPSNRTVRCLSVSNRLHSPRTRACRVLYRNPYQVSSKWKALWECFQMETRNYYFKCLCVGHSAYEPLAPPPPPSATAVPVWQDRTIASSKLRMLQYSAFMEVQRDPDNVSDDV